MKSVCPPSTDAYEEFCCECTLLDHVLLLSHKHPPILLGTALNPFSIQPIFVLGLALMQVQDLALGFIELHQVHTKGKVRIIHYRIICPVDKYFK